MRVKIIKGSKGSWSEHQVGSILKVTEGPNSRFYSILGNETYVIPRDYVEILPLDPAPQPEPFDLKRALKGEKFYHRMINGEMAGGHYYIIGKSKHEYQSDHAVKYVVEQLDWKNNIVTWRYDINELSSFFMAPKEPKVVTKWVNVYFEGAERYNTDGQMWGDKLSAEAYGKGYIKYIDTFPIQITFP